MKKYENAVKSVVHLLYENKYDEIISKSKIKRGEGYLIENEIVDYPGSLTMPPDKAYEDIEVIKTENKTRYCWSFIYGLIMKKAN